jgi:hypothetical protein
MKNIKIISLGLIIGFILLSGLMEQTTEAQPSKVPEGGPFLPIQPKNACRMDPSIAFTEEQAEKLANLQRAYFKEVKPLWNELRDLRIELRFAVADPQVQPQTLFDKQQKFSALQARLENLLFSYRVNTRAVFTREQFERFPPGCPLKTGTGYGMGKSKRKGSQKEIY